MDMYKNKIAFVGPNTRSIFTFRKELIYKMIERGWEVHVISDSDQFVERVKSIGVKYHEIAMSRFVSPLKDLNYIVNLCKIFRKYRFDIVHTFTVKPNVYGSIANALTSRSKLVSLVEGFGFMYGYDEKIISKIRRNTYFFLNKVAFRFAHKVWFINQDDKNEMIERGVLCEEKTLLIKSIGVNLGEYNKDNINKETLDRLKRDYVITDRSVVVTLVSRMSILKGIREFIDAARSLEFINKDLIFLIVGEIQEGSPYSMTYDEMNDLPSNAFWVGFTENINEINYLTDIVCLPTYYREGVPRSLIEAMAFGKPLVVTDSVGCREIVIENYNGFLVPVKDSKSLSNRINELANDKRKRESFGGNSLTMCEMELDVHKVNQKIISQLYELPKDE